MRCKSHLARGGIALFAVYLLAACEPQATPFPVDIPDPPTATPSPGPPAPIRYALAANTAGAINDILLSNPAAQITQLDEPANRSDLGARFDLIVTFGTYPDATPAPTPMHVTLLVNTTLPPLDDPAVAQVILRSINPAALLPPEDIPGLQIVQREALSATALRTEMANAGRPDGLDLRLTHDGTFGVSPALAYFQNLNIQLELLPLQTSPEAAHLSLITWVTPEQREARIAPWNGAAQPVDLYAVPISYWADPGLNITYSPQGWPLAARP